METAITSAAEAESFATLLADRFAAPFLVWERGVGGWHSLGEDTAPATAEQSEWFDVVAAAGDSSPQVRETSDGLHVACPSVNAAGETQVVCGTVELTRKQVAQLAVREVWEERDLSNQILELRELADGYGEKLAESFEELSFFRRLANHVEYCDASRQLTDVAAGVLPSMRQVAGLEGIALVLAADDGSGRIGTVALREAAIHASDTEWIRAIGSVPQRESGVSVVNLRAEHAELADHFDLPGVRSFVLAPIRKDGCLFGWLLGVNKCTRAAHDASDNGGLGHDEIGSTEASLLEAATVLLATHAANVRLVVEKEELVVDAIHTLVGIIEAKDAYTCGHSDRVALLSRRIARELQMDESTCHNIYLTGLLHDVGKVGVSDDVLLKPGQLTDEEFEQIKRHPECGWRLLQRLKPLRNLLDGVRYHHESLDGGGYPEGLAGDEIPLVARIIAVADAWDAMTSDRPYRAGMSWEKAEAILRRGAGQQWDADVVEAFFAAAEDVHDITRTWKDHLRQILDPLEDQSAEGPAALDASEMLTHAVAADLGL